eukprot:scaffold117891_cov34-Tisochrysis_lutea.AAC.4
MKGGAERPPWPPIIAHNRRLTLEECSLHRLRLRAAYPTCAVARARSRCYGWWEQSNGRSGKAVSGVKERGRAAKGRALHRNIVYIATPPAHLPSHNSNPNIPSTFRLVGDNSGSLSLMRRLASVYHNATRCGLTPRIEHEQ